MFFTKNTQLSSLHSHCPKFQSLGSKARGRPGFAFRHRINDTKISQRCSHEPLSSWDITFFFSLGTLPDLEKLVPSEKQKGCICCQENASVATHPRISQRGFRAQIPLQAHLKCLMRNYFDSPSCRVTFLTASTGILHLIPIVGLSSLPQCGNEHIKRSRVLELTSVAFSAEESFAPGKDVQIGLGCVFFSGFQSLSASPI